MIVNCLQSEDFTDLSGEGFVRKFLPAQGALMAADRGE